MAHNVYIFLHLVVRSLCTLSSLCHSCQFIVLWPSNFNYVFSAAVLNHNSPNVTQFSQYSCMSCLSRQRFTCIKWMLSIIEMCILFCVDCMMRWNNISVSVMTSSCAYREWWFVYEPDNDEVIIISSIWLWCTTDCSCSKEIDCYDSGTMV